jgi:hypothetical protein
MSAVPAPVQSLNEKKLFLFFSGVAEATAAARRAGELGDLG